MKKLVLTVLLLSFAIAPCFAMKVITNKELDRTVPSRTSGFGYNSEVNNYQDTTYRYLPGRDGYRYGWGYQGVTYEKYYKPIIGRDIRTELIGTNWNYPLATNGQLERVSKNNSNLNNLGLNKKYIREAADYFIVDTINHPQSAVPAGNPL